MVYLEQVAEVQEHVCGRVKEHTAQATVAGGAGGGRAGQGLPDALRHSRSGGASGWPSAGRPACDNARSTPGAPPSAAGCPWGQMDARPTGPVRALQNEQSHGPARRREAPELATVPGQPRALRRPGRTDARASELTQRRHRALCASPHGGGTASTRAGSRGGLPSAGLLRVRRCARRTSNCANRGRLRGGEQDRDGAGRGPGCHRQTGGWPQCGPSTCARALRLHVLKVRIQLRQVKRTNSLL